MNSTKNDKSKQFDILINDELKSSIDENDDEDDSNEKPLLDRKDKSILKKKQTINTKKGGYYELSKQERENVNELFESSNSKIVNAIDYDDDDDEFEVSDDDDDDDNKDEETNEQTQLTRQHKKKGRHSDKKSIRKKLFGSSSNSKSSNNGLKSNLSKQNSFNSTDDELSLGKIKILIPRKKNKSKLIRYKLRKLLRNFISLFFLLGALIVVFILLYFKRQYLNQFVKDHLVNNPSSSVKRTLDEQSKHCDMLIVNNIWNQSFPDLIIGNQLRLIDVNTDDQLDILVVFGTSIDQTKYSSILCQIYYNQQKSSDLNNEFDGCGGGLLLLDGRTGEELWRTYTRHRIESVNCFLDLDGDNINDCFATGPRAQFYSISGRTGRIIWKLDTDQLGETVIRKNLPFQAPLLLPNDVDTDGFNDLLVMHGGDYQRVKTKSSPAKLICLSSRSGSILRIANVPDEQDSHTAPVLVYRNEKKDLDTAFIIYGTGSFNTAGSLWSMNLTLFLEKNTLKGSVEIYKDCCKGILTPPVLIDIDKDHVLDIVIAYNSTLTAFNGRTLVNLWRTKFSANTEFFVQPAVGYFDGDNVPDFLVQYESGDGFPNNYYSEIQVVNGQNGKFMLKDSFKMLIGGRSSPITISLDTKVNKSDQTIDSFDLFLFWQTTCDNQEQELKKLTNNDQLDQLRFKLKFNSMNELLKTDLCRLRFNKTSINRLNSVSYGNVMTTIYDYYEIAKKELEQNHFNSTKIVADYLAREPNSIYDYFKNLDQDNGYVTDAEDTDGDIGDFMNNKRGSNDRDQNNLNGGRSDGGSSFNVNNGFYLPGLSSSNDKLDQYPYNKQRTSSNDYSSFNFDKGSFSIPNQQQAAPPNFNLPNMNSQNDNPFNQNSLANLLNQLQQQQQQQPKLPPPFQNFELNNMNNNRNRFVKKKSSPYDDRPTLEEIFQRRRIKRQSIKSSSKVNTAQDAQFIHKIYSTATLAPSKLENGIDLIFATSWIPETKTVKLIKKSNYDECIRTAQKNKEGQFYSKGNSLDDFINYCLSQMNKNDDGTKKASANNKALEKQLGSSTIYRNSLKCKNQDFKMKPYQNQIWPSSMGLMGNSMANA